MLSIKLVRSLVLGETINNPLLLTQNHHDHDSKYHDDDVHFHRRRRKCNNSGSTKTPLLLFLPTKEVIKDTYRLATIAREMGMDLYPTPSLSHVIFSWSSSSSPSLASSFSSSSSSWSLSGDAIPLPFPSLTTASATHLSCFVHLSRGLFKLVFYNKNNSSSSSNKESNGANISNWDCSSLTLFSKVTGECINSMDSFSRVLAGVGWTLFKTRNNNPSLVSVYLFRKVDSNRVRIPLSNGSKCGEFRIRELRLPPLDFKNAPLRILQYILLMTDGLFYLA